MPLKDRRNHKDKATVKNEVLLRIALSNLTHKKLRSALTIFGIAIGIGAVYFLLSFGLGLQKLVTNEVIGSQSIKTIDISSPNSAIIKLDDVVTQRVSEVPDVQTVGKTYFFPGSYNVSNSESDAIVYGIDKGYEELTFLNLTDGKLLSTAGGENKAVINKAALESIGLADKPSDAIDKKISLIVPLPDSQSESKELRREFTVSGVIDSGSGAEIFIDINHFKNAGLPNFTQVKVGTTDVERTQAVRAQIESFGLETTSPVDTLEEINRVFNFLNFILVGFGTIGMIIAVLGMFNTLTISLLERTKEIGLMIALGGRSIDMKRLFIIEAILLAAIGAIIGMFSAYAIGHIVTIVMNIFASKRGVEDTFELFSNPPILVFGTLIFMVAVGLIVAYLPARRAQKINPIDALRRE